MAAVVKADRSARFASAKPSNPSAAYARAAAWSRRLWMAQKAGRPYIWPAASPVDLDANSSDIPFVTRAQLDNFVTELFKVVPRRQWTTRQTRRGAPMTVGDRLRMLTTLHVSWTRAAATVLGEAVEGNRNETGWTLSRLPPVGTYQRMSSGAYYYHKLFATVYSNPLIPQLISLSKSMGNRYQT